MFFIALFYSQLFSKNLDTFMWVQIESMTSKESIDKVIKFATQNRYSNLLVQVRSRDNAAYNSKIVSKYNSINTNFDPLKYIIEKGHINNIKIHAWLNMYVSWSGKYNPKNKNHLINVNSKWRDYSFNKTKNKFTNHYLSPIHPEVNNYLLNIIKEVCNNYNIDGIHLDYIRFKDLNFGNNNIGLKEFAVKMNYTDFSLVDKNITQNQIDNWNKFKVYKVTELVKQTHQFLKLNLKNTKLSVAVKPNLLEAKSRFSQDWGEWLKSGIVDYVLPMNYYSEMYYFNRDLKLMANRIPEPLHFKIIMGIGCYNQSVDDVIDKVSLVKMHSFGGISIFSFDNHKNELKWFYPLNKILTYN
ncbi:MAG: family 10 glycosylhydrolase [Candidatus Marinimicrobia bacterium]|nr:family 10 glycosylhydrolase [Candidatus Neomarinimicrobiota bacterium]